MNIDKDGKLDMFGRATFRILEEYGWNVESMADVIIELRDELEKKEKEANDLRDKLNDY